jgi:phosphatidylglycerol:prolipoprotein diacylglycerol transferase
MTFLANSYFHTLDPFLVRFPPSWPMAGIRWYGLAYALGFIVGWLIVRWVAGKPWSPLPKEKVGDLMFAVIIGVLVGGRLGYVFFYEPKLLLQTSNHFPFWDLLAINKGGMASHGGMIGVILAVWWFGKRNQIPVLHILDIGSLGCAPGLCFGRVANFINAELWGKPLPSAMQGSANGGVPWWSIKYPQEITEVWYPIHKGVAGAHPQAVVDHATASLQEVEAKIGPLIGTDNGFFDRVVEVARDVGDPLQPQVESLLRPMLTAHYPSQIFQAISDGPVLIALLVLVWLKPRKPGVVGSWFLILYGILRVVTEIFRQPDEGVALILGLSRGQLLSVLMIATGFVCLAIAKRRAVPRLGGLFSRAENPSNGLPAA